MAAAGYFSASAQPARGREVRCGPRGEFELPHPAGVGVFVRRSRWQILRSEPLDLDAATDGIPLGDERARLAARTHHRGIAVAVQPWNGCAFPSALCIGERG